MYAGSEVEHFLEGLDFSFQCGTHRGPAETPTKKSVQTCSGNPIYHLDRTQAP